MPKNLVFNTFCTFTLSTEIGRGNLLAAELNNMYYFFSRCDLWDTYKFLKNKVTHVMRKSKREYNANQISQNHNNSKKMWRCLRDLVPKSLPISPNTINVDGANVSDNVNIAEAFNDFLFHF